MASVIILIIVPVSRVKEETVEDGGEKRSGYAGYDELWESDEDGDMQELSELLRDGFISDYKHGTILPHVLPLELQSQFVDLMDKNVQKDLIDEEETLKAEMESDTKERIFAELIDEREVDDGESPTSKHSRKAARILRSMATETRENDLFMIQLPSILKVLSQEKLSENKVVLNNNRPNGTAKLLQDGREGETLSGTNEKSTVEQLRLPHGKCIGKLVVTRDGRVKLNVGGHSMDVAHTASEGQHQGVVMVETTAQPQEEGYGLHNGHGRFGNPSGGDSNAIYYLGHVHHHLTASLDWKQLRPIGVENTAGAATDELASPSRKPKSADVDRLRKELNDLQKQRSKDISAALKRWNA
ncbi:unnamed protein product [Heligmosomoides polygyrus]|uniref:Uncharacterized protein n=1 Tax=Heligmosomoides polygyrus TaxID=6339 RepID=A0A3P7YXG7_HELPZ|nr:unnamed protein product [Heligmosomoides polygyrus]